MLALALMIQPLVVAVGQVHDLAHAAGSLSIAAAHEDHHAISLHADEAPTDPESKDPVHLLMHFAHCCSQPPSALGFSQAPVLARAGTDAPGVPPAELRLLTPINDVTGRSCTASPPGFDQRRLETSDRGMTPAVRRRAHVRSC